MDEEAELIEKSEAAVVRKTIVKKFTTTVNSEDDDNADEHVIRDKEQLHNTSTIQVAPKESTSYPNSNLTKMSRAKIAAKQRRIKGKFGSIKESEIPSPATSDTEIDSTESHTVKPSTIKAASKNVEIDGDGDLQKKASKRGIKRRSMRKNYNENDGDVFEEEMLTQRVPWRKPGFIWPVKIDATQKLSPKDLVKQFAESPPPNDPQIPPSAKDLVQQFASSPASQDDPMPPKRKVGRPKVKQKVVPQHSVTPKDLVQQYAASPIQSEEPVVAKLTGKLKNRRITFPKQTIHPRELVQQFAKACPEPVIKKRRHKANDLSQLSISPKDLVQQFAETSEVDKVVGPATDSLVDIKSKSCVPKLSPKDLVKQFAESPISGTEEATGVKRRKRRSAANLPRFSRLPITSPTKELTGKQNNMRDVIKQRRDEALLKKGENTSETVPSEDSSDPEIIFKISQPSASEVQNLTTNKKIRGRRGMRKTWTRLATERKVRDVLIKCKTVKRARGTRSIGSFPTLKNDVSPRSTRGSKARGRGGKRLPLPRQRNETAKNRNVLLNHESELADSDDCTDTEIPLERSEPMSTPTSIRRRGRRGIARKRPGPVSPMADLFYHNRARLFNEPELCPQGIGEPEVNQQEISQCQQELCEPGLGLIGYSKLPETDEDRISECTESKASITDSIASQGDPAKPKKRRKRGSRLNFCIPKKKGQYSAVKERIAAGQAEGIPSIRQPRGGYRGRGARGRGRGQRRDLLRRELMTCKADTQTLGLNEQRRQTRRGAMVSALETRPSRRVARASVSPITPTRRGVKRSTAESNLKRRGAKRSASEISLTQRITHLGASKTQQTRRGVKVSDSETNIETHQDLTKNEDGAVAEETMFTGLCDMDTKLLTNKGVPKPKLITNILMSTKEPSMPAEKTKRRRRKKCLFTRKKAGFKTLNQCRLFNTRIAAVKTAVGRGEQLGLAERLLLLRSKSLRRCRKGKKPPTLKHSDEESDNDKTDDSDNDTNDENESVTTIDDLKESTATDSDVSQSKTLLGPRSPSRRNRKATYKSIAYSISKEIKAARKIGKNIPGNDDQHDHYNFSDNDEHVGTEVEKPTVMGRPIIPLPTETVQEPLQLIDGLNKKLYCGFAQVVSTVSRKFHCMFCSFVSTVYNSIGTHVSDEHSTLSTAWFANNAVKLSKQDSYSFGNEDLQMTSHTVNSEGSMFCCYVDKCSKRFHRESQFIAHQIVHSFLTPAGDSTDAVDSCLSDSNLSARCSPLKMTQALLQRTKRHGKRHPNSLEPPPTIIHCEVDDVKCDIVKEIKPKPKNWILSDPVCHCKLGKCEKKTLDSAEELREHCLTMHKVIKHAEIFYCGYCPYACTDMPQAMIHSAQKHPIKHERHKGWESSRPSTPNVLDSCENTKGSPLNQSNDGIKRTPGLSSPLPSTQRKSADFESSLDVTVSSPDSSMSVTNRQNTNTSTSTSTDSSNISVDSKSSDVTFKQPKRDRASAVFKALTGMQEMCYTKPKRNVQSLVVRAPSSSTVDILEIETELTSDNNDSDIRTQSDMSCIDTSSDNVGISTNDSINTVHRGRRGRGRGRGRWRGRGRGRGRIGLQKTQSIPDVSLPAIKTHTDVQYLGKEPQRLVKSKPLAIRKDYTLRRSATRSTRSDGASVDFSGIRAPTRRRRRGRGGIITGVRITTDVNVSESTVDKQSSDIAEEPAADRDLKTTSEYETCETDDLSDVIDNLEPTADSTVEICTSSTPGMTDMSLEGAVISNLSNEQSNSFSDHDDIPCLEKEGATVIQDEHDTYIPTLKLESRVPSSDLDLEDEGEHVPELDHKDCNVDMPDLITSDASSNLEMPDLEPSKEQENMPSLDKQPIEDSSDFEETKIPSPKPGLSFAERLQHEALLQTEKLKRRIERLKWRNRSDSFPLSTSQENCEPQSWNVPSDFDSVADHGCNGSDNRNAPEGSVLPGNSDGEIDMPSADMEDNDSVNTEEFSEESMKLVLEEDSDSEMDLGTSSMEAVGPSIEAGDEDWTEVEAETGADLPEMCETVESDHELPLDEDYLMTEQNADKGNAGGTNEVWTSDMDVLLEEQAPPMSRVSSTSSGLHQIRGSIEDDSDLSQSQDEAFSSVLSAVVDDSGNERNVWSQLIEPLKQDRRVALCNSTSNVSSPANNSGYDSRDDTEDTYPSLTKYIAPGTEVPSTAPQTAPILESISSFRQKYYKQKDNVAVPMYTKQVSWGPKCKRDIRVANLQKRQEQLLVEHSYSIAPLPSGDLDDEPPTLTQEVHKTINADDDVKLSMRAVVVVPDIVKVLLQGY